MGAGGGGRGGGDGRARLFVDRQNTERRMHP